MSHAPQEEFWIWFAQHQAKLFDFETDQEDSLTNLLSSFRKFSRISLLNLAPKMEARENLSSAPAA